MKLIALIKELRHKIILASLRFKPLQDNKILLWSNNFTSYGDSPKYIAEYFVKYYNGKYDLVWVFEKGIAPPPDMPCEIRVVNYFSVEYLKEICTAKIIICNTRTSPYHYFNKRKGQYYIQTWHSSLRLKKIEGDAPMLPSNYIEVAQKDSEKIDLLLSGCAFSTDIFRRAFWYDGEVFESGTPRCDVFFCNTSVVRDKVFRFFGLDNNKKLAIYAPTFRSDKKADLYGMNFSVLQSALGDEWYVGCRLHPNLNSEVDGDICIPMSRYPDMQELLVACDLLITDYSSSMFDMVVAGKVCVLYVPDLKSYCKNERGLYFEPDELPFKKAVNMDELCNVVKYLDTACDGYKTFLKKIGSYEDGRAAERVCERINQVCYTVKKNNRRKLYGKS